MRDVFYYGGIPFSQIRVSFCNKFLLFITLKTGGGNKMKLMKSTNKNNKGWSIEVLSLIRLVKQALLIFLMSLIGTEIGIAQESKSNVQEKHSLKSGQFYESVNFTEITREKRQKIQLIGGDLLLITPKEDKDIEIVTDISIFAKRIEILLRVNKLKEISEKQHYFTVGLLFIDDKILQLTFNVGVGSISVGTLWPPNLNEMDVSISISNRFKGSGYIYIFVIDSSVFSDVYSVTVDGVINSVILSNIIIQPIHFVSK